MVRGQPVDTKTKQYSLKYLLDDLGLAGDGTPAAFMGFVLMFGDWPYLPKYVRVSLKAIESQSTWNIKRCNE